MAKFNNECHQENGFILDQFKYQQQNNYIYLCILYEILLYNIQTKAHFLYKSASYFYCLSSQYAVLHWKWQSIIISLSIKIIQSSKLTSTRKMSKRNSMNSNYQNCSICFSTDPEVISITDAVFNKISSVFIEFKVKNDFVDLPCHKLEPPDFGRLFKMIFSRRFKNIKVTSACKHVQLKKSFMRKLGCTQKQLDKASGLVSWRIAKFQFHTDVILAQTKSFLRHFIQSQQSRQSSRQQQSNKKQSQCSLYQVKQENNEEEIVEHKKEISKKQYERMEEQPQIFEQYPILWHVSWQPAQFVLTNSEIEDPYKNEASIEKAEKQQKQNLNNLITAQKAQRIFNISAEELSKK